jgi:hypothetical protein
MVNADAVMIGRIDIERASAARLPGRLSWRRLPASGW